MVKPDTVAKIEAIATAESRSISNTVAFLLESHPKLTEAERA